MPSLCQLCGADHAYPGYLACNECLDLYGTDAGYLEALAIQRARMRTTQADLTHTLKGLVMPTDRTPDGDEMVDKADFAEGMVDNELRQALRDKVGLVGYGRTLKFIMDELAEFAEDRNSSMRHRMFLKPDRNEDGDR